MRKGKVVPVQKKNPGACSRNVSLLPETFSLKRALGRVSTIASDRFAHFDNVAFLTRLLSVRSMSHFGGCAPTAFRGPTDLLVFHTRGEGSHAIADALDNMVCI